jgi:hypothetical protein
VRRNSVPRHRASLIKSRRTHRLGASSTNGGASDMVYVKCNVSGTFKSSVDKFYDQADLTNWAQATGES